MSSYTGHSYGETINISGWGAPVAPETAHAVYALGGNDTVYGSAYTDFLFGDAGNDTLYGNGGNDVLLGGTGNDVNYGGAGNDSIYDGAGADTLVGGAGDDILWGGAGNDAYWYYDGDGLDVINDDKAPTGATGFGGGTDVLHFQYAEADIYIGYIPGDNNLYVTTNADLADGQMDEGVIIEDFFLGGNNVIETIITSDNHTIHLV